MTTTFNFCCCCRDDLLNETQTRNWMEVIIYIEGTNQDTDDKRKGEEKEVTHSFCKKEKYRLSCLTCLDTVHTPYPWKDNSSSSQERRGRYIDNTIRMAPIGWYIIHCTRHKILIATSLHHHHHEWLLHCHPCTKLSIPICHPHININSITQSYVYTWNDSVVIILGGTDGDGHGRDNKFNKEVAIIQHINASLSFRPYVPTQSYITINNSRRTRRRVAKSVISSCTVLIGRPYNI